MPNKNRNSNKNMYIIIILVLLLVLFFWYTIDMPLKQIGGNNTIQTLLETSEILNKF
jgi:hypothetical protein